MNHSEKANRLANESSPYLQQHAYNPVDWYPWGNEALRKASDEDKPIIVSIGYSSCHWCHVMERESFEDEGIAQIMNEHFINIKVDREERPDVDQIYMDAVHLMGQQGGWPLNVFLLPNQEPFYGGTYFRPQQWSQLLLKIAEVYKRERKELEASAEKLRSALQVSEIEKYRLTSENEEFKSEYLDEMFSVLKERFDTNMGGMNKAPKFPMPSIWQFLLQYQHAADEDEALNHVTKTLDAMANGGIYDHIGGGFSRYSVDGEWFAPHFEKMLYDNAQLLSLFAKAYQVTQNANYAKVIRQTVAWMEREMLDSAGGFFSALDADSEGVEGKFYTWTFDELKSITGDDTEVVTNYFEASEAGNWEEGRNILHRRKDITDIASQLSLSESDIESKILSATERLLIEREKRIRPGLDDKVLAGWNGLAISGLVDSYNALGDHKFLTLAADIANLIKEQMLVDGKLLRLFKDGRATIDGYLEDYAFVISGLLNLYQSTFDEKWLDTAAELLDYTFSHFYDETSGYFYYTDDSAEKLIARKFELIDNVIPASNSEMAHNLLTAGLILDKEDYKQAAHKMLDKMLKLAKGEPEYTSNWGRLLDRLTSPAAEIVITGPDALTIRAEIVKQYHPNIVVMGTSTSSELPLLKDKLPADLNTIFVCQNKVCQLPVHSGNEALEQLKRLQ